MKGKKLLAAFLLGVGLCFVPALGHGEILGKYGVREYTDEVRGDKELAMESGLLEARVDYMMRSPTSFLNVEFYYDPVGMYSPLFPEDVDTKEKIWVDILDNRGVFSDKSGVALLKEFKRHLEAIFSHLGQVATDIDNDVVVSLGVIPCGFEIRTQLAYFYQGEYHLWEK